jgi:hypothetical protein
MSRLRVGDIEIDGSNITIGGVPQTPAPKPGSGAAVAGVAGVTVTTTGAPGTIVTSGGTTTTAPTSAALVTRTPGALAQRSPEGLDALASFPIGHRLLVGAGSGLAVAAAALLATTEAIAAVPMLFSGIGGVVVGILKRRALRRREAARARDEEREYGEHAARLRALLAEARPEQTVEWIIEKSGLPEATVVRTLAFMRDRHEVTEELNTETGEWYYGATLALPPASRHLDERLAALEQGDRKP